MRDQSLTDQKMTPNWFMHMSGKMNPKDKLQAFKDESGVITSDREEMATILNNQFKQSFL